MSSSVNSFPELFIPYIYFFILNSISKQLAYSGYYSPYVLYNFTKTLCLTLSCRNSPMKSNCCTLDLLFLVSSKEYFRFLIGDFGDQVSRIIYLFCKYLLTKIIVFNLSILPSYWIFPFMHPYMVSLYLPFSGSYIRKV